MEFIQENLNKYCIDNSSEELDILKEIERKTHLEILRPRMLSGKMQAIFLGFIVDMLKPKKILEIGTYTAYATIAMANKLLENSKLITIEKNIELEDFIRKYISKANLENKIELKMGDAKEIIPNLNENFDLVFLDADKINYPVYLDLILPKMNKGAYIITDNVLWSGKVVEDLDPKDVDTKAILDFNKKVKESKNLENLILPFRDGLNIIKVL